MCDLPVPLINDFGTDLLLSFVIELNTYQQVI